MEQFISRRFHIGDIISIIKDINVSPRGVTGLIDILSFLIQDDVEEEEIPKIAGWCRATMENEFEIFTSSAMEFELAKLHIMLEQHSEGEFDRKNLLHGWLAALTKQLGESRIVQPLYMYQVIHE